MTTVQNMLTENQALPGIMWNKASNPFLPNGRDGSFEPLFIAVSTSCFFDSLKYEHSWLSPCCYSLSNESH